jgi:MFS family permease
VASPAAAAPALTGGASTAADRHARSALFAAVLGFFVVTLDAVVVNVTLPTIRGDLDGGVAGLQWVVDGYTLMFAALLLSAGSLSDASAHVAPSRRAWACSSWRRSRAGWRPASVCSSLPVSCRARRPRR